MTKLAHRRYGNFPQRRATLLPRAAKRRAQFALEAMSSLWFSVSNLATTVAVRHTKEQPGSTRFCGMQVEPSWSRQGEAKMATASSEHLQRHHTLPGRDQGIAASLRRIKIHPEAQRILGNSRIAIVCLERLRVQSRVEHDQLLTALQPVVSLARLPCQPRSEPQNVDVVVSSLEDHSQQNGSCQNIEECSELRETSTPSEPAGPSGLGQSETTSPSWTESYSPAGSPPAAHDPQQESGLNDPQQESGLNDPQQESGLNDPQQESGLNDPQQESGLNGESNSGPLYIHFESVWSVKTDSEQSDLDAEPELNLVLELDPESEISHLGSEQNMVIESDLESSNSGPEDIMVIESDLESSNLGPEDSLVIEVDPESHPSHQGPEQNMALELDPESESKCESKLEPAYRDNSGDQCGHSCSPTQQGSVVPSQQSESGDGIGETESEDFCAVCLNGGDLLCCDRCPKVYHLACHLPPLISFPLGDWVCTLCRTDQDPAEAYECENTLSYGGVKAPYTLSNRDQRRCEKLTLLLSCHMLSAPFHEPVSPLARNYYQIIKRPIDLSVIRRKLDKANTLHYFTAEQFVDDVLLMFKNCATFNYPDSEVAQAGRSLEVFFLSKLREIFADQTFPMASQDRMDTGCHQWLNRKRKENYRKRRHVFSGKRHYL